MSYVTQTDIRSYALYIYTDKNECLDSNGQCSDICVNEKPGYHCECNEGELDVDQHTCTGK